jgi:hypothetical protein
MCERARVCLQWEQLNSLLQTTELRTLLTLIDMLQLLLKSHSRNGHLKAHFSLTSTYSYVTLLIFIGVKIFSKESCTEQARQLMYKPNIETRSRNHNCRGKAITITYSERVSVALSTQHAKRMRPIIFLFVTCLDLPYFPSLSNKWHDWRKKVMEHKLRVLIFPTNFVWNISHSKKNSARYFHKCTYSSRKVSVTLAGS